MSKLPRYLRDLVQQGLVDRDLAEEIAGLDSNEEIDEDNSDDGPRKIRGLPVVNEDGERLAFLNPKSSSDVIHIAKIEKPSSGKKSPVGMKGSVGRAYNWSECGFGSSGKRKSHHLYIDLENVESRYIERDDEIVGRLCKNCLNAAD